MITHLTFLAPVMDVLCKGTPYSQHELTQLRSKIFRHVHLCSAVHVQVLSMHFCIIVCAVTFPFLFTPRDEYNRQNSESIAYQDAKDMHFHPKN